MGRFRRFTRDDWYGYEGCGSLPEEDGRPLIREETVGEGSVTYLISGPEEEDLPDYVISVHIFADRNGGGEEWWYKEAEDKAVARRTGALLPADGDRTTLRALGFQRTI